MKSLKLWRWPQPIDDKEVVEAEEQSQPDDSAHRSRKNRRKRAFSPV
jgi:fused signal recognition particle receptor